LSEKELMALLNEVLVEVGREDEGGREGGREEGRVFSGRARREEGRERGMEGRRVCIGTN